MDARSNGINMVAVKKKNRSSILNLIYYSGGISRKEIANKLNLTPAAITLIATDLINEDLLIELPVEQSSNRKGRKEIILEINNKKFAAIGIYISVNKFRILCIDLNKNVLFDDTIFTADCHKNSKAIMDKICSIIEHHLIYYDVTRTKTLLGIGVSIKGIVNTQMGVSVNSFQVWEENVNVVDYLQSKLDIPIILTNNICSLAHGESFLSQLDDPDNMLFIKYGPGVGAARVTYQDKLNINDFNAIELGHMISDPSGVICPCGKQGCLETIASYDSIIRNATDLLSESLTPILYSITQGNPNNITISTIIKAYEEGEKMIEDMIKRVTHYLSIAIINSITLFDPKTVILYGELFDNEKFRKNLNVHLSNFSDHKKIKFSHYSLQLETLGPASTVINHFFENGGIIETTNNF